MDGGKVVGVFTTIDALKALVAVSNTAAQAIRRIAAR